MRSHEKNIEEILKRHLPLASQEETETDCNRVLRHLQSRVADRVEHGCPAGPALVSKSKVHRTALMYAAAAALLAAFVGTTTVWRRVESVAVVEHAEDSFSRVVEGQSRPLAVRDKLEVGDTVRTSGMSGAVFSLADGLTVEMRSDSELSLELADDGLRIHLARGGVIVNAATQRHGRLNVRTKEVTVWVVGTVFLVSAEEGGSRVAVIEGEVHVRQGPTEKKLLPGEQIATNPWMVSLPVKQEIAWSRSAEAHVTLLQQSFGASTKLREAFVVESVRPSSPDGPGDLGAIPGRSPCTGRLPQINPGRFVVTNRSVYTLIVWAYGKDCDLSTFDFISGGPGWIRSDAFDIEALIPEGSPTYTPQELFGGDAPNLQMMLQTLLKDRFKLALRRDVKEVPVYLLMSGKGGPKLKPWSEGDPARSALTRRPGQTSMHLIGGKASMSDFALWLARATRRPVLDRTGVTGTFNYDIEYMPVGDQFGAGTAVGEDIAAPSLFTAIKELGLELKASKEKVEVLVIEHLERPSEN